MVHTVLRYSYLLPGNLWPILSCFVAYFVVKTVVYSYLCPEKGGPYCPVYSSFVWERLSLQSSIYLRRGNDGPYCPVYILIVGTVDHTVLY